MPTLEHGAPVTSPASRPGGARVWVDALLDLVFPAFCPVCRARLDEGRRDPLCGTCWARLERIHPPCCRACGVPVTAAGPGLDPACCGHCRRHPPPFAYARSAARYEDVVREALHALKFHGRRALAAPLGDLLAEVDGSGLPSFPPALLVPVPLHPRREADRGFNQALLLARRLGAVWRVPVRADVLRRTVATAPQTDLSAAARRANVRGAFTVRRPDAVAGLHVAVIDDVYTTGSTAAACVRCLRRAGAASVGVLTVARAL